MDRATVSSIAELAGCSQDFVRKTADRGFIEVRRDLNGWRVFPNPEQAAKTIRGLLLGEIESVEAKRMREASSQVAGN